MLQQTVWRVVREYWKRWMSRFPTVKELAQASPEEVLRVWEGLGYYRRALHLHQAAQVICEARSGRLPTTLEDWVTLPGVGPYIASALMAIAYNYPSVPLDANLIRIGNRLWGSHHRTLTREGLQIRYRKVYGYGAPRELTEALMTLGQEVCRPHKPLCSHCPLTDVCRYFRHPFNPVKRTSPIKIFSQVTPLVLVKDHKVLVKRVKEGRFKNMAQIIILEDDGSALGLKRDPADWKNRGLTLPVIVHYYTRYVVKMEGRMLDWDGELSLPEGYEWITWEEVEALPFPSAHRRLLRSAHSLLSEANQKIIS